MQPDRELWSALVRLSKFDVLGGLLSVFSDLVVTNSCP